jgi:hypothetical protein
MVLVAIVLIDSIRLWISLLTGAREQKVTESPFVVTQLRPEEV